MLLKKKNLDHKIFLLTQNKTYALPCHLQLILYKNDSTKQWHYINLTTKIKEKYNIMLI